MLFMQFFIVCKMLPNWNRVVWQEKVSDAMVTAVIVDLRSVVSKRTGSRLEEQMSFSVYLQESQSDSESSEFKTELWWFMTQM